MKKGDNFKLNFKISEQLYQRFILAFNDRNPLHTSDEFARLKGFRNKVMHGNILNGFVSYFIGEYLPIKNVIIQMQDIKYFKPIYLDEELDFMAEVTNVFESVNTIEIKFVFKKSSNEKVASGNIQIGILK